MTLPTRTAREYPTMGSHRVPVETCCRWSIRKGVLGNSNQKMSPQSGGRANCGLIVLAEPTWPLILYHFDLGRCKLHFAIDLFHRTGGFHLFGPFVNVP